MNKKKALFFDIDGTLVSFMTHRLPDSTIEALQKAHDVGHKIFIATGRPFAIINNITPLQERGIIDGYVTMNGAYCFINDKVIHKTPLSPSDVTTLAGECEKNNCAYVVMTDRGLSVVNPTIEVKQAFNEFLNVIEIPETTFNKIANDNVFQITPFFDDKLQEQIAGKLENCEFNRWYPTFVDVTAKGITKAIGIQAIAEHAGFDIADTIAFGDGGNDIPMLRAAGTSVAMGNAADNVKENATHVTSSVDENGIANALKLLQIIA